MWNSDPQIEIPAFRFLSRLDPQSPKPRNSFVAAVAALWTQFVQEVRWFWEEAEALPHVAADGPPDLACCLVHQKLQMVSGLVSGLAGVNALCTRSCRWSVSLYLG